MSAPTVVTRVTHCEARKLLPGYRVVISGELVEITGYPEQVRRGAVTLSYVRCHDRNAFVQTAQLAATASVERRTITPAGL